MVGSHDTYFCLDRMQSLSRMVQANMSIEYLCRLVNSEFSDADSRNIFPKTLNRSRAFTKYSKTDFEPLLDTDESRFENQVQNTFSRCDDILPEWVKNPYVWMKNRFLNKKKIHLSSIHFDQRLSKLLTLSIVEVSKIVVFQSIGWSQISVLRAISSNLTKGNRLRRLNPANMIDKGTAH